MPNDEQVLAKIAQGAEKEASQTSAEPDERTKLAMKQAQRGKSAAVRAEERTNQHIEYLERHIGRLSETIEGHKKEMSELANLKKDLGVYQGRREVGQVVLAASGFGIAIGGVLMGAFPSDSQGSWLYLSSQSWFGAGASLTTFTAFIMFILALRKP